MADDKIWKNFRAPLPESDDGTLREAFQNFVHECSARWIKTLTEYLQRTAGESGHCVYLQIPEYTQAVVSVTTAGYVSPTFIWAALHNETVVFGEEDTPRHIREQVYSALKTRTEKMQTQLLTSPSAESE